ncbi:hypothetical protein LTR37_011499 [Vermiconidia calcicola]|uniref:Uncharacterized protein n=1 Tax=Vermiconidia calcicola TaxID=1690605 RepID=A0ACC3N341_9PEZI|nr:hypothetical protein LTR37_011499 [Vermiconidia calcicola]
MAPINSACASCGKTDGLKHCARCKQVSYCSPVCQKTGWKEHKKDCRFTVSTTNGDEPSTSALSILRYTTASPLTSAATDSAASIVVMSAFNTAEIRMAVLSLLLAKDLLSAQGVCRLWYRHITLEDTLQQRLFLKAGPGKLVMTAGEGDEKAIQARNEKQADHAQMTKSGDATLYVFNAKEESSANLEKAKVPIILNPFFTKLWPQHPTNMTTAPYITLPSQSKTASCRRMQLTSPPMVQLDASVWATRPNGKGTQLRPSTGRVPTGVTLGHVADLLLSISSRLTLHWVSIDGHAWWAMSTDALVAPRNGTDGGDNASIPEVYVNPSNGIAFPGFL